MAEPKIRKLGIMDGAGEWSEDDHPRDEDGKFTNGGESYNLPDELVPKSVGAKWSNYDIKLPNGEIVHIAEGSKIYNKEVFAGKGTKTSIREVELLLSSFGGNTKEWIKVKGITVIEYDGEEEKAEIHWYEDPSVGKVLIKVKPQKDGGFWIK